VSSKLPQTPCRCRPSGRDAAEEPYGIETAERLASRLAEIVTPSSAIVCVGNELCADDGAGVQVGRRLAGSVPWHVCNAQTAPESFLMEIADRKPRSLVLVDALDFGAAPGATALMETGQIGGQGPSTHGPAPVAFLKMLNMIHPCRCVVLGIQPQTAEIGEPLTEPVLAAVDRIVKGFQLLAGGPLA